MEACGISNRYPSTTCAMGTVYDTPVACGFRCIGQSGRCLNTRMTEHKRNFNNRAMHSQLARHVCSDCNNCEPQWDGVAILARERNPEKRSILQTLRILTAGNCVGMSYLSFSEMTREFLGI